MTDPLVTWRYGPAGYGLTAYPELGLTELAIDDLREWSSRWFARGNAALWLVGPRPPADLRLDLPDGPRHPPPRPTGVLPRPPAYFTRLFPGRSPFPRASEGFSREEALSGAQASRPCPETWDANREGRRVDGRSELSGPSILGVGGGEPERGRSVFGLDVFGLDDRMRLFSYVTAENRLAYLWVLRAFDAARSNYHVLMHTTEVAARLRTLSDAGQDCPDPNDLDLPRLLDALVDWGVLDRAQDATRAASLSEYRNRHSVYQFTEAGYRAHRAVETVLTATMDDSGLSRLVFADLLADLAALAQANVDADAEEVYRKLNRLDRALADIAERAARFYHMLGDLSRTNDTRPEVFLAHKDALLTHLRDFHDELQRYSPRLREAVEAVERTGLERLVRAAAEADERIFRSPAERLADWERRWAGLRSWLAPPGPDQISEADRLAESTISAIGDVLALLRRVTEARRGGVSRESQLRHLAAWFTAVGSEEAAHALFDAAFGLGAPRHVGVAYADPETIATRASWWDAPAVELSRTLVETGREPGSRNQTPARLDRADQSRARLRQERLADERRLADAAAELAEAGLAGIVLDDAQTAVLLRLLDLALSTRIGAQRGPIAAAAHGVRLTLTPRGASYSTIATKHGSVHIDGYELAVTAARQTTGARA